MVKPGLNYRTIQHPLKSHFATIYTSCIEYTVARYTSLRQPPIVPRSQELVSLPAAQTLGVQVRHPTHQTFLAFVRLIEVISLNDTPSAVMPPLSHKSRVNGLLLNDVILPSRQLPMSPEADSKSLRGPCDQGEQPEYVPQPVHSPTPQKGYLLPYAYGPQGSRSSEDIGTLTMKERNVDDTGISCQRSEKLALSSSISLPLSQHGLVRNSSRADLYSRTPQPVKVSSPPTPVNTAPPDYSRPSLPPLRTILPMSTASVQRWNRNIVVYVSIIPESLLWLIRGIKLHRDNILPGRSLEIQVR